MWDTRGSWSLCGEGLEKGERKMEKLYKQKMWIVPLGLACAMGGLSLQAYDAVLNQKDSSATGLSCFTNAASWTPE